MYNLANGTCESSSVLVKRLSQELLQAGKHELYKLYYRKDYSFSLHKKSIFVSRNTLLGFCHMYPEVTSSGCFQFSGKERDGNKMEAEFCPPPVLAVNPTYGEGLLVVTSAGGLTL